MSVTRLTLSKNIAKELGYVGERVCSAAGTTTTIVDTAGAGPFLTDDDERLYQNAWAKIEADSAGLNVGEVRRIKTYTPSSQTLTLSNAFTSATSATQTYGVYLIVPPTRIGLQKGSDEYINDTLRALFYRTYHLLTLVTDGDMETTGVDDWTRSSLDTSLSIKTTTAAYVALGKQSLRVKCSSASGYARSATVAVAPGDIYDLLGEVKVSSGTARLQLYDETNSAAVDADTTTDRDWRWLRVHASVPTGCYSISVRLVGDEATADAYWDNVSLRPAYARRMDLPSWLTGPGAVEDLVIWRGGIERAGGGWASVERYGIPVDWWEVLEDSIGQTARRIEYEPQPGDNDLLFLRALRPYAELSADTGTSGTTDANSDLIEAGALARIGTDIAARGGDGGILRRWLPEYARLLTIHQPRVSRRLKMRPY